MQRAGSQRLESTLANERSRHPGKVIIGAARGGGDSLRARGRPRVLRQHFERKLPLGRVSKGHHTEAGLRPFAADDATEIVGERRQLDTNHTFTLILHEPATAEPSHRDRDVWAAHTGELSQFAVTH